MIRTIMIHNDLGLLAGFKPVTFSYQPFILVYFLAHLCVDYIHKRSESPHTKYSSPQKRKKVSGINCKIAFTFSIKK